MWLQLNNAFFVGNNQMDTCLSGWKSLTHDLKQWQLKFSLHLFSGQKHLSDVHSNTFIPCDNSMRCTLPCFRGGEPITQQPRANDGRERDLQLKPGCPFSMSILIVPKMHLKKHFTFDDNYIQDVTAMTYLSIGLGGGGGSSGSWHLFAFLVTCL